MNEISHSQTTDDLAGRVAIVTGGSFGIGRATAIRLAQAGAKVAILARDADRLRESETLIAQVITSQNTLALTCDMTQESQVINSFTKIIEKFGLVDVIVSNAGSIKNALIEDTTLQTWEDMYAVLVRGYFLIAREGFRHWKSTQREGSLVFVASKNSVTATPGASAYSSAKAAELHLARCLAEEGGPFGIRVNSVLPDGVIAGTGILPPAEREKQAARHGVKIEELEEYYRKRNALKRSITVEDVAEAILFLASDRSYKITGAVLPVDGGMVSAYMR
jgi:NAD(P)-dependent dehydrogenase (short-subunit alcohol dehydrogenase family)